MYILRYIKINVFIQDESTSNLTNLLRTGQVGAVTVHLDVRPSVVSMLFFHGNYYSLWDGQVINF